MMDVRKDLKSCTSFLQKQESVVAIIIRLINIWDPHLRENDGGSVSKCKVPYCGKAVCWYKIVLYLFGGIKVFVLVVFIG